MPIYVYQCTRCHREIEEIQKYDDPPPRSEELCTAHRDYDEPIPCDLVRVPTTFTQRWPGDYSNDGRGGWVRQGDAMVRTTSGKESTKYGEGTV